MKQKEPEVRTEPIALTKHVSTIQAQSSRQEDSEDLDEIEETPSLQQIKDSSVNNFPQFSATKD